MEIIIIWFKILPFLMIYSFLGELIYQINQLIRFSPYSLKKLKVDFNYSYLEHSLFNYGFGLSMNLFVVILIFYSINLNYLLIKLVILNLIFLIFSFYTSRKKTHIPLQIETTCKLLFNFFSKIFRHKKSFDYFSPHSSKLDENIESLKMQKKNFNIYHIVYYGFFISLFLYVLISLIIHFSEFTYTIFSDEYAFIQNARELMTFDNFNFDPFGLLEIRSTKLYGNMNLIFYIISPNDWYQISIYIIPQIQVFFIAGYAILLLSPKKNMILWVIGLFLIQGLYYFNEWITNVLPSAWIFVLFLILCKYMFDKEYQSLFLCILILFSIFFTHFPSLFIFFTVLVVSWGFSLFINSKKKKKGIIFALSIPIIVLILYYNIVPLITPFFMSNFEIFSRFNVPPSIQAWENFSLEPIFRYIGYLSFPLIVGIYFGNKFGLLGKNFNFEKIKNDMGIKFFFWFAQVFLMILLNNFSSWFYFSNIPYSYIRYFIYLDFIIYLNILFSIKYLCIILKNIYISIRNMYLTKKSDNLRKFITFWSNSKTKNVVLCLSIVLSPLIIFNYKELLPNRWISNTYEDYFYIKSQQNNSPSEFREITIFMENYVKPSNLLLIDTITFESRGVISYLPEISLIDNSVMKNWLYADYNEYDTYLNFLDFLYSNDSKKVTICLHTYILTNGTYELSQPIDYILLDLKNELLKSYIISDNDHFEIIKLWDSSEREIAFIKVL